MRRRFAAIVLVLFAQRARAGTFDARGVYEFDPAAIFREGFAPGKPKAGVQIVAGPFGCTSCKMLVLR